MSKQVQIIVENEFVTSDVKNQTSAPTVFDRAFRKLTHEETSIGKLFPIYIKVEGEYYVLGVFTLNRLGSTSLFLELPDGTFFDHITFGKNLIPNKTHLTEIVEGKRKKVTALEPTHLSNGTYHVLTLIIKDLSLLKLAPKEIVYPPINIEYIDLVKDAISTRGDYNGSGICEAPGSQGVVVVQLFLIPNEVNCELLQATKFGHGLNIFDADKLKNINGQISHLGHEFQHEYQFGIVCFRYDAQIDRPLYLEWRKPIGGSYFNSSDVELKQSVLKAARDALSRGSK